MPAAAVIGQAIGTLASQLHSQIFNWVNFGRQKKVDDQNFNLQRENYELQKQAFNWNQMQTMWEREQYLQSLQREDTAVQRRVADLKAAGLSPVLAAGQAATTMGPISPNHVSPPDSPPQKQTPRMPNEAMVEIWNYVKDYLLTTEQLKQMQEERKNLTETRKYLSAQTEKEGEMAKQIREITRLQSAHADWEEFRNSDFEYRFNAEYALDLLEADRLRHDKKWLLDENNPSWINMRKGTTPNANMLRDLGVDPNTTFGKFLQVILALSEQVSKFLK